MIQLCDLTKVYPSREEDVVALAVESASGDAAKAYANIIAVKRGNESSEKTKALLKVLKTKAVYDYITNTYQGAVLPVFEIG